MAEEIQLPLLVCVQCGYSWHPIRPRKPKRCSNHECRSFCWDPTKYQSFHRKSASLAQPETDGSFASPSRREAGSPIGVELHDLRSFLAVAEERSFAMAARRLHISQAILSRHIRKLEAMLNAQLLVRHRGSVELTHAGRALSANSHNLFSVLAITLQSVLTAV
jgi:hypothetical protein